jgi:predicted Holliday junction resolvase-like endonuclease
MLFIKESRHIFSVCPICGVVHRLSDLQIARKGDYQPDWLDKIDKQQDKLVMVQTDLEEKKKELRLAALERGEATELPKLLQRVAPMFVKWKTNPRDVRTIFNPVEFVVFDGMNGDGVRSVSLVHIGGRNSIIRDIERAIERKDCGWKTLQVADDGTVSEKQARPKRSSISQPKELFRLD